MSVRRPIRPRLVAIACAVAAFALPSGCSSESTTSDSTATNNTSTTLPPAAAGSQPTASTADSVTTVPDTTGGTAPATNTGGPAELPTSNVPPGDYLVDTFSIPFQIRTSGDWIRAGSRPEFLTLRRSTTTGAEFYVTTGLVSGATPEEALQHICSSSSTFGTPTPTMLLGVAAVQEDGTATSVCNWAAIDTVTQLEIPQGHMIRVVAADIGGTIVVVVADASADEWAATIADVEPMIASMMLVPA